MLILVHGLKQSGKSTIAKYLASQGFKTVKFAGTLKNMLRNYLVNAGYSDDEAEAFLNGDDRIRETPLKCFNGKSTRHMMQYIGTEFRDTLNKALWTNIADAKIRRLLKAGDDVVVDDLRFPHEITNMKPVMEEFGGFTWAVIRNNRPYAERIDAVVPQYDIMPTNAAISLLIAPLLEDLGFDMDESIEILEGGDLASEKIDVVGHTPVTIIANLRAWWEDFVLSKPVPVNTTSHASEVQLDEALFDYVIHNNGTLAEFEGKVTLTFFNQTIRAYISGVKKNGLSEFVFPAGTGVDDETHFRIMAYLYMISQAPYSTPGNFVNNWVTTEELSENTDWLGVKEYIGVVGLENHDTVVTALKELIERTKPKFEIGSLVGNMIR